LAPPSVDEIPPDEDDEEGFFPHRPIFLDDSAGGREMCADGEGSSPRKTKR